MNLLISGLVLILICIILIIYTKLRFKYDSKFYNDSCDLYYAGIVIGCAIAFLMSMTWNFTNININTFEKQKIYLETHISKNEIEDAALTTKKIELNQWLFQAQYGAEHYSFMSFYPEDISEWEPIQ